MFSVGDPNILSDHSILNFSLISSFDISNLANEAETDPVSVSFTYKWDRNLIDEYKARLRSEDTLHIFEQARTILSADFVAADEISSNFNTIVEGIESCTKPLFSRTFRTKKSECVFNDNNLPWFDDNCRIKRQEFYFCLNFYREDRTDLNRINMVIARAIFKSALRKARFLFDSEQTRKLNELRYKNAKEYWKLLRNA